MVKLNSEQLDVLINALTDIRNTQIETGEQVMNITVNDMYKDIHLRYETFIETFTVYESFEECEEHHARIETHIDGVRFFALTN